MGKAHGLRGQVVVRSESDNPDRFSAGSVMWSDDGRELVVKTAQALERGLLVKFVDVGDRTSAEELAGSRLWIDAAHRRPLDDDEYWPDQLVGLAVLDTEGSELGTVSGVVEGAAQDRLAVSTSNGVVEIPFVADLITVVDLTGGMIVVEAIEGLIESQ